MKSAAQPCASCQHFQRCKHGLLACRAFVAWVDTGSAPAALERDPSRETYVELAAFDDAQARYQAQRQRQAKERRDARLAELRRQARRETFERKRLVAAGLAAPLSDAERRKIQLARRRLRWKIAPELRERYLLLKREDAIRRGRRNGSAPKGSDGNRVHRAEGQRRRREAERTRQGRTMSGQKYRELRVQLGLSIREIADRFGVTYSAAKQWQRPWGPPANVERWLRALATRREEVPAVLGSFSVQAPPAASGYLEAQPL
ncbi:MAG: hypothetical protein R3E75_08170 [Steroidobacteraceae bacterium]|nr:hypothetical protein [Nevskiaceae bacterium]MCP5472291.1 hypothetical protein [Nevskiaceae bacterium]